jgi:hypothetical protein
MSLRTFVRIAALALGLLLFSPLLWPAAGPWPLLAGLGLSVTTVVYLLLASGGQAKVSRWQLRYQMERRQANERLDAPLAFLVEHAGHVVLEANGQGLFLEAPVAFDRYIQAQFERALPEARVSRVHNDQHPPRGGAFYLCLDPLAGDPLCWATEAQGRGARLHLHRGVCATLVAQAADETPPPGAWVRIPAPGPLATRLWRKLPVWDELAVGSRLRPSHLLPATGDGAVYSSRSRLLHLAPPDGYQANGDRRLGETTDGRALSLHRSIPLFTTGAPASFLVEQAHADLRSGRAVVVVSPRRRVLNLIQREAQAVTYWLDPENIRASAHLAIAGAEEWDGLEVERVIGLVETFLTDLGLDLHLSAVRTLVRHLVRILAASAQATGHDFAFTDLYAIGQSTQTLRAFLADLQDLMPGLDPETQGSIGHLAEQLEGDTGYVQVVTVLSMLRAVLSPLRSGAVHVLCQPPFVNAAQVLKNGRLLLVPTTNADFPEYDRFLAAMLDLTLSRVLASGGEDSRLRSTAPFVVALHLHDPHRYGPEGGRRWVGLARRDARLSLLVDVQNPDGHTVRGGQEGELVFRCSEALASSLIQDWSLDYTAVELTELPAGAALARLPGLPAPVTLQTRGGS